MTTELAVHDNQVLQTYDEVERAAKVLAASGFFQDSKMMAQAVTKILAGRELGFGPFASMTGVHIIQNKPVLAANLMAAAVKRTGKYNYRVVTLDDNTCEIAFFEAGQEVGRSKFTMADATKAGLPTKDNWKKFPRNMLFARALSNGQKWYAPDVFNGATVYTPDELGAEVDDEGNAVIEAVAVPLTVTTDPGIVAKSTAVKPERPYTPEQVKAGIQKRMATNNITVGKDDHKILASVLNTTLGNDTDRYTVSAWLTGEASTKKMTDAAVRAMLDWQGVKGYDDMPADYVLQETRACLEAANADNGQLPLVEGE